MLRRPDGYSGKDHQTIGSDILSVLNALIMPESVLGRRLLAKVKAVQPNDWYPIEFLLEVMEVVETRVGKTALSSMGRRLFQLSHAARLKETARAGADIIFGIDGMYHHANQGKDIGGWKVVMFQPGRARLEKRTPHACVMEEGILAEALQTIGVPSLVTQSGCVKNGDPFCTYEISSALTDARWKGSHDYFGK
ncbi:MAG: hypothetical protein QM723_03755 [Myxococcaceae bacterium]